MELTQNKLAQSKMILIAFGLLFLNACSNEAQFQGGTSERPRPPVVAEKSSEDVTSAPIEKGKEVSAGSEDSKPDAPNDPEDVPESFSLVQRDFPAWEAQTAEFTQNLTQNRFQSDIITEQEKFVESKTFTQSTRPWATDQFKQGKLGTEHAESFSLTSWGKIDVLIVIDNSRSMAEEQANLSEKLSKLINDISDADWRIAITTTDPKDPTLRDVISKGERNIESRFRTAIKAGTLGIGYEQGIKRSIDATMATWNRKNWIREKASLAILIVSDEDNCQDSKYCPPAYFSHEPLIRRLQDQMQRKVGENARIYGLIKHPSMADSDCASAYATATVYAKAIEATKGRWGSICADDFGPTLQGMSIDMAQMINRKFEMTLMPELDSFKLFVDDKELTEGFKIDGKLLTLTSFQGQGQTLKVQYRSGDEPMKDSFPLSGSPALETLSVSINDQEIEDSAFKISSDRRIVFESVPEASAQVKVKYRVAGNLRDAFPTGAIGNPNSIKCLVDGIETPCEYDSRNQKVQFAPTPPDGSAIQISHQILGKLILFYPWKKDPETFDYKVHHAESGNPIPFTMNELGITFAEGSITPDEKIIISYSKAESQESDFVLPHTPLLNSIVMDAGQENCNILPSGLTNSLRLRCRVVQGQEIRVKYRYISRLFQEFSMNNLDLPEDTQWRVFLDGVETKDYEVENNVITLTKVDRENVNSVRIEAKYKLDKQ